MWHHSLSGRLNLAPLPPTIHSALDLGCGTGAWAINFGEAHPECRVIGCDLSPIQPTLVPPNVEFLVDDITSEWVYSHKFDYIHSRAITVGIRDWHKLVDECWRWLQPGGWIEFQEYHMPFVSDDGSIENGPAFKLWNENMLAATNKAGTHLDAILGVGEILKTRGFTSLGEAHTKWPLGPWAKGRREKKVGSLLAQVWQYHWPESACKSDSQDVGTRGWTRGRQHAGVHQDAWVESRRCHQARQGSRARHLEPEDARVHSDVSTSNTPSSAKSSLTL